MAKHYFASISTTGFQDKFTETMREHTEKLNNYLNYGVALDNIQYGKLAEQYKGNAAIVREVKSHSTTMELYNKTWCISTTLCCEDEITIAAEI